MKKLLILILLAGVAYWVYENKFSNPLVGEWISDKEATLAQWEKDGVTGLKKRVIGKMLGEMRYQITADTWAYSGLGVQERGRYEILSSYKDCYNVQSHAENTIMSACIIDDKLYIPVEQLGSKEIFRRVN